MPPVAALDCGTNSTRLLVLDDEGAVLARKMRITRLGEGVDATGELAEAAVARTLEVLRAYRTEMDRLGVDRARLAATSAARDARNGGAFLAEAEAVTGVPAELLSGEEEGQLSFAGATRDLDQPLGDVLVVDIGGGSTELAVDVGGSVRAHSMQVGCVRLTERFLRDDPPTSAQLASAAEHVDLAIKAARDALPVLAEPRARSVVGLAGTVSTLAALDLHLEHYDEATLHHHWLSLDAIRRWLELLSTESTPARRERIGMAPGREDVIVAGVLVLERVVVGFDAPGCLTSEHDILDGLAHSVLAR